MVRRPIDKLKIHRIKKEDIITFQAKNDLAGNGEKHKFAF